nr:helicase-related protein [Candidatus Freyarchaeota archaeon]
MSKSGHKFQYTKSIIDLISKSDPYLAIASNYPVMYAPIDIYPHQVDLLTRVMFVRPIRIFIGDEIGIGKTIESIAILRFLEKIGELNRALIIVPKILTSQWVSELMRMGIPMQNIFLFKSGVDVKEIKSKIGDQKYFVISIGLVRMEQHLKKLLDIEWDTILVDEAHNVTLKSLRTKNAIQRLSENIKRNIIFLSATPHRGVTDDYLFRLRLLDPSLVGEYSKLDINPFYESTHDSLLFRRSKEVVNNLQDKVVFKDCRFQLHLIQPTPEETAFMNALFSFLKIKAKELGDKGVNSPIGLLLVLLRKRASSSPKAAMKTLNSMIRTFHRKQDEKYDETEELAEFEENVLGEDYSVDIETDFDEEAEKFIKRYSKALNPRDIEELSRILQLAEKVSKKDSKLKTVKELILELLGRNEGKVLVFTEYRDTLDYIIDSLRTDVRFKDRAINFETLSGKDKERFDIVKKRFEDDPSIQVLVATDVASEGINLQKANHTINYDAPWSPIKLEQRIGRIWRLGQQYISYVYNMFLSTAFDLAIVEKLYEKLLNIERAVGSTKPILGEEVRIANLKASSSIWRTGEIGQIDYKEKKVRLTEYRLIYAELTDQLDEFINAFLTTVQNLNNELSSKKVFPIISAKKIKSNLKRIILTDNLLEYEQVLADMATRLAYLEGKSEFEINTLKHAVKIIEYLRFGKKERLPKLLLSTSESEYGIFHIIKVRTNDRDYYIIYDKNKERVLVGINLLRFVAEISKNGFSAPKSSNNAGEFEELKINQKGFIRNTVQMMLGDILSPYRNYFRETGDRGIRKNGWNFNLTTQEPEIVSTIIVTKYEEVNKIIDKVLKDKIEIAAMEISKEYEESKKDVLKVDDVHAYSNYDLLSHIKDDGERYIEAKGHIGMKLFAELPPSEYKLAEEKGDNYYLHLVINLQMDEYEQVNKNQAVLLEFQNPLKTMQVKRIGGKERYILFP